MKQLATYEIDQDIRSIEFNNNVEKFQYFEDIAQKARTEENAYFQAFTAMIQMEEAANSKRLIQFDLEYVKLDMYSRADQVFRIQYDVSIAGISLIVRK